MICKCKRLIAIGTGIMMIMATVLTGCGGKKNQTVDGQNGNDKTNQGQEKIKSYETRFFTKGTNTDALGILICDPTYGNKSSVNAVMKVIYPNIAKDLITSGQDQLTLSNDLITFKDASSKSPSISLKEGVSFVHASLDTNLKSNFENGYTVIEKEEDCAGWVLYTTTSGYYRISYFVPDKYNDNRLYEFQTYLGNKIIEGAGDTLKSSDPQSLEVCKKIYDWCKEHVTFGIEQTGETFNDFANTSVSHKFEDAFGNDLGDDYVMASDARVKSIEENYSLNFPIVSQATAYDFYTYKEIKEDLNELHDLDTENYGLYISPAFSVTSLNGTKECDFKLNGETYELIKYTDEDKYAAVRQLADNSYIILYYGLIRTKGSNSLSGVLDKDDVITGIKMVFGSN